MDDWRGMLTRLRATARRLDSATDQVDDVVRDLEYLMAEKWRLEVEVVTEVFAEGETVEDGQPTRIVLSLGFGWLDGRRRIYILEERGEIDEAGEWVRTTDSESTPWAACRRDRKLKAFPRLPELVGLVADTADELAGEIAEAGRIAAELIGTRRGRR